MDFPCSPYDYSWEKAYEFADWWEENDWGGRIINNETL